jgi:hypothetical protein
LILAYSTVSEIESDFKDLTFTTTSNVKTADVTQFIVEADALINAYVGTVYTVPLTAGEGLSLLKLLCRSLVAARVKRIMEVKQDKNTDPNQAVIGVLLSPSQVMKILTDIQASVLKLDGGELLSSSGGFYSANDTNDVSPTIEKDTKQW